jgi:hypothetical protein
MEGHTHERIEPLVTEHTPEYEKRYNEECRRVLAAIDEYLHDIVVLRLRPANKKVSDADREYASDMALLEESIVAMRQCDAAFEENRHDDNAKALKEAQSRLHKAHASYEAAYNAQCDARRALAEVERDLEDAKLRRLATEDTYYEWVFAGTAIVDPVRGRRRHAALERLRTSYARAGDHSRLDFAVAGVDYHML